MSAKRKENTGRELCQRLKAAAKVAPDREQAKLLAAAAREIERLQPRPAVQTHVTFTPGRFIDWLEAN